MGFYPNEFQDEDVTSLSASGDRWYTRYWVGVLAALILVTGYFAWQGSVFERVGSLVRGPSGVEYTPADQEVFRKMSFLTQTVRAGAPEFSLEALGGGNRTLQDYKGKVVLLNFWATWCPPCLREMPAMQKLYDRYRAKGFDVVAISVDQGGKVEVQKFIDENKLTFPVILDPTHAAKGSYKVRALPTNYLLDRQGRVIAWGMGSREWDGESAFGLIEQLLAEKG